MGKQSILFSLFAAMLAVSTSLYAQEKSDSEVIFGLGGGFQTGLKSPGDIKALSTLKSQEAVQRVKDSILGFDVKAALVLNRKFGSLYSLGIGAYGIFQFQESKLGYDIKSDGGDVTTNVEYSVTKPVLHIIPVVYQRLMFLNLISISLAIGPTMAISLGDKMTGSIKNPIAALDETKPVFRVGAFTELGVTFHLSRGFGIGITGSAFIVPKDEQINPYAAIEVGSQKLTELTKLSKDDLIKLADFSIGANFIFTF